MIDNDNISTRLTEIMNTYDLTLSGKVHEMVLTSDCGCISLHEIDGFRELQSVLMGINVGYQKAMAGY